MNDQICAVCCGTKRLTEIQCPSDCTYLAAAREHPAAAVVRQQQQDLERLVHCLRDLSERQAKLFFAVTSFLATHRRPGDLQAAIDDDVAEAAEAIASTYETAARGVIYEHRPASVPAERLVSALKPLLAEAGQTSGSAFDRDAAVVLRRVEEAVRAHGGSEPGNRRAFLEWLSRVMRPRADAADPAAREQESPRLIVP